MQEIDLPPHQWESERPKPKEPFWGPGWPLGLSVVIGIGVAAYLADGSGNVPILGSIAASVASYLALQFTEALRR